MKNNPNTAACANSKYLKSPTTLWKVPKTPKKHLNQVQKHIFVKASTCTLPDGFCLIPGWFGVSFMTLLLKSEQTLSPMPTGHTHKKHPKPRKKEHNQNSKCRSWYTMCMVYCGLFLSFVVLCWVVCYFKADVCAVCVLCVLCVLCVCCVCLCVSCVCVLCMSCVCPVCVDVGATLYTHHFLYAKSDSCTDGCLISMAQMSL